MRFAHTALLLSPALPVPWFWVLGSGRMRFAHTALLLARSPYLLVLGSLYLIPCSVLFFLLTTWGMGSIITPVMHLSNEILYTLRRPFRRPSRGSGGGSSVHRDF
jgi:hypothetical protein